MVKHLPYFTLKTPPKTTALLKQAFADFIVREDLGYEMSGEGEFVAGKKPKKKLKKPAKKTPAAT